MQTEESPYSNGRAVQAAIKSAAQRDVRAKSFGVGDLIRQATFDRFLCRVFSVQSPQLVLKGGTGMLARLSTSRATKDIDLSVGEGDLEAAVTDLSQLATVDLGVPVGFEPTVRFHAHNFSRVAPSAAANSGYIGSRGPRRNSVDLSVPEHLPLQRGREDLASPPRHRPSRVAVRHSTLRSA